MSVNTSGASQALIEEYYELNEKLLAANDRLQATIDEHNQEIANSALLFAMACEREVEQQATIEELERTVEAKRQTIEHALMIDEKQQNKIAEQKATIEDLEAEIAEWESGALVRGWREQRADRQAALK